MTGLIAFVLMTVSSSAFGKTPPQLPSSQRSETSPASINPIEKQALARNIAVLASDEFKGRAPASTGGQKSRDYIAGEFKKAGLKPAANGTYFQSVPLVESTLDIDKSSLTFDKTGRKRTLKFGKETVFWTKRTVEDVSFQDRPLVFVGYGVVAPEYGWNDYKGLDVRGKTVVILVNDPGFGTKDPKLFKGRAMTYYGRWTYKYEEAARQGAAAALIIHETKPASYPWEVVESSWSGAQFDLKGGETNKRAALEGWITLDVAKNLFKTAGLDFNTLKKAAQKPGFKPVPMPDIRASGTIKNTLRDLQSANVVGLLPGAKAPDEYVVYMAHWDHLGEKKDIPGEDHIFNGAVDNATGVAGIINIAKAFAAAPPPDRSILFISVTAEESGLLGSKYFAEHPLVPLKNIVGGMNIDAMLPVGRTKNMVVVGYGASELEGILKKAAARYGKHLVPDPEPETGSFYRSDHISFSKKGVPMLYTDGGFDHVEKGEAYGRAFAERYKKQRYHRPADEYNENWDLSGMVEDLDILYQTGRALSKKDVWPNWYEGNEFRMIRDKMRAKL